MYPGFTLPHLLISKKTALQRIIYIYVYNIIVFSTNLNYTLHNNTSFVYVACNKNLDDVAVECRTLTIIKLRHYLLWSLHLAAQI